MNDRLLADIRWLVNHIRTNGPVWRNQTPKGREEMARLLADRVYELDENIRYNRAPLPRDWSKK